MTDALWQAAYLAPTGVPVLAAVVVLYVCRRRAPRACRLGALAFAGLLAFDGALLVVNPVLVYGVQNSDQVSLFVWKLQLLSMLSAFVHGAAVVALTAGIVMDRPPPPADEADPHA